MAGSLNKVTIIGNVGKDPEIRSTQEGREIANLTIATSESWKDKSSGEKKEKTEWHRVSVFNEQLVRVVKDYVKKGTKLYLEGAIQTRKWTDQSGVEKYSTEIVLQGFSGTLLLLSGKDERQEPAPITQHNAAKANAYQPDSPSYANAAAHQRPVDMEEDSIPF